MSKPEELAEKEVEKKIAKAIASRTIEIRRYKAKIKEIEKEIKKIIEGDLVPDLEDDESSSGFLDANKFKNLVNKHLPNRPIPLGDQGFADALEKLNKRNKKKRIGDHKIYRIGKDTYF